MVAARSATSDFARLLRPGTIDVTALCGTVFPALVERNPGVWPGPEDSAESQRVEEFLALLLDEDDDGFDEFLFAFAARSRDPQQVAASLLGPAARLLGDYWRMDVCDFMKVTVVMSRIQRLFWRLAGLYPPRARLRHGRTALLTPGPAEQHNFGLAVVEDGLRRAGWQVDCCGVDELEAYYDLVASNSYTLVGVSVSGNALASDLPRLIGKTRRRSRNPQTRIMVGGNLFLEHPEFALEAGSDFLALDAASAVSIAETAAASVMSEELDVVAAE
jgi:MerR family transcriptional regulator, light-induced transcriptional regulator